MCAFRNNNPQFNQGQNRPRPLQSFQLQQQQQQLQSMQSRQPNQFAQSASFRQGSQQRGVVPNNELAVDQNARSRQMLQSQGFTGAIMGQGPRPMAQSMHQLQSQPQQSMQQQINFNKLQQQQKVQQQFQQMQQQLQMQNQDEGGDEWEHFFNQNQPIQGLDRAGNVPMRQHGGNVHNGMEQQQSFATNFPQGGRQQRQENSFQPEFQSIPRNVVGPREDLMNSFQPNVNSRAQPNRFQNSNNFMQDPTSHAASINRANVGSRNMQAAPIQQSHEIHLGTQMHNRQVVDSRQ
jgi:hypothetical protein